MYRAADRLGVYPLVDHYHDPPVRDRQVVRRSPRTLPGIDLRLDRQLDLLGRLQYGDELLSIPVRSAGAALPYYANPSFAAPDAQIYYSLIRHFRPRRVIEVGSGQSTRFAVRAMEVNRADGFPGRLVAIEPYESPELEALGVSVVRSRVEEADVALFADLHAGDMLFIDSSHIVRPGGDVTLLLLDVIPALLAGVLVHVHDVFTPRDPPREWTRRRWLWAEQYVLEGLLTYNPRLEVLLAVDHLMRVDPAAFSAACPALAPPGPGPTPGSFWLRTVREPPAASDSD